MKLKLKNIFSLLITLSLLSLSLIGLTHLLRPVDLDIAVDAVEVFHELPKDSIDVLCLGSSHMWRGLDPLTLYHEHGFSVYNYGCVAQKINTTLLFLQDAFRMQSPRVIIIDAFYANRLNDNKTFNSELYSTKHISFSKNKLAYLHSIFGWDIEAYFAYLFPLASFHSNWETLFSVEDKTGIVPYRDLHETLGFAYSVSVTPSYLPSPGTKEQLPLDSKAVAVLDEIVALCKDHDAQLIFIVIPYEKEYQYDAAMRDYASKNDCLFLNLFDHLQEIGLDVSSDFSDTSHLNASGAAKVASFIGQYLADNFTLPDHSGQWNNPWEQRFNSSDPTE